HLHLLIGSVLPVSKNAAIRSYTEHPWGRERLIEVRAHGSAGFHASPLLVQLSNPLKFAERKFLPCAARVFGSNLLGEFLFPAPAFAWCIAAIMSVLAAQFTVYMRWHPGYASGRRCTGLAVGDATLAIECETVEECRRRVAAECFIDTVNP